MIDTKKVENVADNGIAVNDPDLQEAIGRDGTAQELLGADINGNGYVTRDEFIIYQKLLNPIVSSEATVSRFDYYAKKLDEFKFARKIREDIANSDPKVCYKAAIKIADASPEFRPGLIKEAFKNPHYHDKHNYIFLEAIIAIVYVPESSK